MENKNNKGLIVLIVVLIIMVLGLGGYIVYDKVIAPLSCLLQASHFIPLSFMLK